MNIGIIIQARLGSTRFPRKILKPFHESETMLDIILGKLHRATKATVIVATTTSPNDTLLADYLKANNELVFRGSENDVLDRFIKTAETYHLDGIVRICSDNPFLDPDGIAMLMDKAESSEAQYIGFRINGLPSIKTHFGFWGEFVTLEALKKVSATSIDAQDHEHVTIHVYSHPDNYTCEWIDCPDFIQGRDDIRLTVDTPDDFANAQQVYADLTEQYPDFGLEEVVQYIDEHEALKASMKENIHQNTK